MGGDAVVGAALLEAAAGDAELDGEAAAAVVGADGAGVAAAVLEGAAAPASAVDEVFAGAFAACAAASLIHEAETPRRRMPVTAQPK